MSILSTRSRKQIASATLTALLVTQFGWLSAIPTYALVSTYTAIQTQASGNPTQSVTKFTISTAGGSGDTLGIAGCMIDFIEFGSGDTDCSDGVGLIDPIVDSSADLQATALGGFTFSDYISAFVGIGEFALTHVGVPIDGNLASLETGTMVVSDTNTVVGLASAVAQVVDFIPADPTPGETYVTTINTLVHNHVVYTPETVAQAVTGIVASLSGNINVSCVDNTTHATCTAFVAGTPFTYIAGTQDITAPTVALSMSGSSPTNTGFTVISTFSEPVFGVDLTDYVVTNGVASSFVAIAPDGFGYSTGQTVYITPTTSGIVTIDMPTQAGADVWGNDSSAATQLSINYDITPPTVTINTIPPGLIVATGAFTVRSTFSDPVLRFTASGFTVTNGTVSGFTPLSSTIYQATITPTDAGPLTITVATGAATDIATNANDVSNTLTLTVPDITPPVITLVGSATQFVTQGLPYIEQTATWIDNVDGSGTINPASSGTVDTSTLGTYILEYSHTDVAGNVSNTATRSVTVVSAPDTTPPVVTLSGSASMIIAHGSIFSDSGADWTDNFDGAAHISIASSGTVDTSTLGTYTLEYTYTDFAGNIGNTVTRSVTVADQTPAVVTLQGSGTIALIQGSPYIEDGAMWTDAVEGTGTINPASSGTVDTSTLGTYILEYSYTDMAGNIGNTVMRTVNITDGTPPIVTLSGSANMTIAHGSIYTELGAMWTDTIDGSGTIALPVTGVVNANQVGTYYLTYNHTDSSSNISNNVIRTVRVTDQAAPVLALDGAPAISLLQGDTYSEPGATWTDAVEGVGNIFYGTYGSTGSFQFSGSVNTTTLGIYILSYIRVDAAGNPSNVVTRTITVTAIPDTTAPVVTLIGSPLRSLTQGIAYIEQGASWTDNYDGIGTIMVASSGSVNTMVLGSYTLEYTRSDDAGNISNTVTRTVTILPDASPPVITLVGAATQYITQSGSYTEQGASWVDTVDGSGNTLTGIYAATGSFQSTGSVVDTTVLGTYTITYTKVDATGNIATATRTIIVSPYVQPVNTGGGGGVSYTPANNTPTVNTPVVLNAAPVIKKPNPIVTQSPVTSSRLKRKILRALLTNRALQRNRAEMVTDMASAPVLDTGLLQVSEVRVNIRLAPTTDARIIGELRRGDQVVPLRTRDGWIEFQFGDIIGWTKRGFLSNATSTK